MYANPVPIGGVNHNNLHLTSLTISDVETPLSVIAASVFFERDKRHISRSAIRYTIFKMLRVIITQIKKRFDVSLL